MLERILNYSFKGGRKLEKYTFTVLKLVIGNSGMVEAIFECDPPDILQTKRTPSSAHLYPANNEKNATMKTDFVLDGNKYSGFRLPDEASAFLSQIYNEMQQEAKQILEDLSEKMLVSAKYPVKYSLVGYDYPEYSASVEGHEDFPFSR